MKENWILRKRSAKELAERLGIPLILAQILRGRIPEADAEAFLDREGPFLDPFALEDLSEAVDRLIDHLHRGHKIFIIGDYDVDGVTSASILHLGLKQLGGKSIIRIPDRVADGYGARPYMIDEAKKQGCKLVLTCDNGIREFETMAYAKECGLPVIITDHHEITQGPDGSPVLPEAECIVNPHRAGTPAVLQGLCGAGVAWKLMQGLYQRMGRELPSSLLGYAALGTVCDLMPLTGENRRIVYQGLREWNRKAPMGIQAMMDVSGIRELTVYHCGFVIGPMINAGGRLQNQNRFIRVLLTQDPGEALDLAEELQQLNLERQRMTMDGVEEAAKLVEQQYAEDPVKVIHLPQVHESIAGLIAGKIKERFYRPTIVLTGTDPVLKGSARSIEGYSMFAELQKQDALLARYGGHPMAAGLSIRGEYVEAFRSALNASCTLTEAELMPRVMVDAMLPIPDASMELAEALERLEPYGNANERPVFAATGVLLTGVRIMGKTGNAARLFLIDQERRCEAITFRMEMLESVLTEKYGEAVWQRLKRGETLRQGIRVDLLYNISINEYRGVRNVQCSVCNMR